MSSIPLELKLPGRLPTGSGQISFAQQQPNHRMAQHPQSHEDAPNEPVVEGDPLHHFLVLLEIHRRIFQLVKTK